MESDDPKSPATTFPAAACRALEFEPPEKVISTVIVEPVP